MSGFELHSFCESCGAHRRRMPFGSYSEFFDRDPCRRCGSHKTGNQVVAKQVRVGRWPWTLGWVDQNGVRVDEPAASTDREDGAHG
jgi:hypothetical protein